MGAGRFAAGLLIVLSAGCVLPPVDPYERACWDVRHGDLLEALVRLERLPPSHPRAAQARALAADTRARMARALVLMQQGLELRAAGRSNRAAELFRRARAEWPGSGAAQGLHALRTAELGPLSLPLDGPAAAWRLAALSREPLPPILGPRVPDSPGARKYALARLGREPVPAPAFRVVARALGLSVPPAAPGDAARAAAVTISPFLRHELDTARAAARLDRAAELLARIPDRAAADPAWRQGWATLFHRRALVRYGGGDIAGAVADWEQALALTPEDGRLRAVLETIREELQSGR